MRKTVSLIISCIILLMHLGAQTPKRQMRGVWIATVSNIDWPSRQGLSTDEQQQEMIKMLDVFQENKINTVVFQVRPGCDAFYESKLEPWSTWLNGKQGKAPEPFYDPLQFVIEQAHKRCMEVHVWINPYRVLTCTDTSLLCDSSVYNKQKHLTVKYGGQYFLDPGLKETRKYLNEVVKEIVTKYDIDAVHFDDYFYPYPVTGENFPDDESFKKDPRSFTSKKDWRRDNVTLTIKQLSKTIKDAKPWVDFGVSPFGVWRHKSVDKRGSDTYKALTNYDDLYADILLWLKEGYIDYVVPQLYWEMGKEHVNYKKLADWWTENSNGKNLYIGLFASGLSENKWGSWQKPNEIIRQMRYDELNTGIKGEMFFSAKYFMKNLQGLNDSLKNIYTKPALVPENKTAPKSYTAQPTAIKIKKKDDRFVLTWNPVNEKFGRKVSYYVVYAFKGKTVQGHQNPDNIIGVTTDTQFDIQDFVAGKSGIYSFTVTSVNRFRRESFPNSFDSRKF